MKRHTFSAWILAFVVAASATVALAAVGPAAQPMTALGELPAMSPGTLFCHQFGGCYYVFDETTGCCEELTGNICPTGRCL